MRRRKNCKKYILPAVILGVGLLLGGCGEKEQITALVTDTEGVRESGISYELWQSVVQITEEGGKSAWYSANSETKEGYAAAMEEAASNDADLIICYGDTAGQAVYDEQRLEKQTDFLLIEARPTQPETGKTYIRGNSCCIYVNPEQAGYLAGYAAVKEGYTNIGFLAGEASDQNIRYGSGYLQGAQYAAVEQGLAAGSVQVRYRIMGNNAISPALETEIRGWYEEGCQLIYACGSGPEYLARSGAAATGNHIIDTDMINQSQDGVVLASAGLNYRQAVASAVSMLQDGQMEWGTENTLGLAEGALGMDLGETAWQNFGQEAYDRICTRISSGELTVTAEDVSADPAAYGITALQIVFC